MSSLLLTLVLTACGGAPTAPADPSPPPPADVPAPDPEADAAAVARAKGAMAALGADLKGRLVGSLKADGPAAAAAMCAEEAPERAAAVADAHDVAVGRSSLRLRNPTDAGPEWVRAWLTEQGERPAAGVEPRVELVDTPDGREARVIAPLAVEGPCVLCHGPEEALAPGVPEVLAAHYPDDAAVGYAVGDLRGAVWAAARVRATE